MEREENFLKSVPPRFRKAHISNIHNWAKELPMIKKWIENPMNFLVLLGCPGSGKTHVSIALARYLYEYQKKKNDQTFLSIEFANLREFFDVLKKEFSRGKNDLAAKEAVTSCKWLILDDLGASRNTEWQKEVVLDIIDTRYGNMLPTIITSNFNFTEIEDIFGMRVRSRLEASENCIIQKWDVDLRRSGI